MGTLTLGSTVNTGTIHGAAGTALRFLGCQTSTGAIEGHRITFASDTANIGGSFSAQQTEIFNVATFTGSVHSVGDLIIAGNASFVPAVGAATLTISSLMLTGTLRGTDDFHVTGPIQWAGGTLQGVNGQGSLTVLSDMTLNGSYHVRDFNLINAGDAVWSGGSVWFLGASRFTNLAGATFDDQIDGNFGSADNNCPIFYNQGLFRKTGGSGATNLHMQLYNSGTVQIDQGILNIHCGYVQVVGSGGSSGTIGGNFTGTVSTVNTGEVTSQPTPTPPPRVTNYTQTATGTLTEVIGGLAPAPSTDRSSSTGTSIWPAR